MHFNHLAFRVKDLEKSIAFYQDVVGLKIARRFTYDTAEICYLKNEEGATEIELIHFPDQPTFQGSGLTVCFLAENLENHHARTAEMGLNPSDLRNPDPGNYYFFVYDPDGVSIQFKQKLT